MGSVGVKSPPLKSSLRQDILYRPVIAELGDLRGPYEQNSRIALLFNFFKCGNASIHLLR